jgi:phosphatidylethanolamine-binding protein (PEBP) family uncharacterized protein
MTKRADSDFPGGDARRPVGMAASSLRRARPVRARARLSRIAALGLLAAAGALAGCGTVSPTASSSSVQPLEVGSPAIVAGKPTPAQFTCSGKNISPPVKWANVPSNTSELALFLLNLGHTQRTGESLKASVTVAWAVHGLKPTLGGISAGKLPAGAVAGHERYSICPPKGGTGEYMFRLYALSNPLAVKPGTSDLALFKQINKASSTAGYFITEDKRS